MVKIVKFGQKLWNSVKIVKNCEICQNKKIGQNLAILDPPTFTFDSLEPKCWMDIDISLA